MNTIITGSKDISDIKILEKAIRLSKYNIRHILCGGAPGVENLAILYARKNRIPYSIYYVARHKGDSPASRNQRLIEHSDSLIVIGDISNDMIHRAKEASKQIFVAYLENGRLRRFESVG